MSRIGKFAVNEKIVEVEYPDIEGFFIEVCYLSREELQKIRKKSSKVSWNKITRQREEEVNDDLFLKHYAEKAVRGWRGLQIKHLAEMLPVDLEGANLDEDVPYTMDDALDLLRYSPDFDRFLGDVMNDLTIFAQEERESEEKNLKSTSNKPSVQ